ncbi:peptidoglycan-binding protein [Embleya scabrispora]|uniref:peptidoglycan-binding protein n=1 Tax=Embleya scabrispora TaxID=159449 RepID=UPI00068D398B|nr:peptidoglycan-binding protein [Embleya scabrispora]
MSTRRRRRRLGRVIGSVAAVGAIGAGAVAASGFGFDHASDSGTGRGRNGLPAATAPVTRQTLIDAQTKNGTLGHGSNTSVTNRLSGTITSLPAVGTTVERGTGLYGIDNTPVVLLYGALPAYRALAPGIKGVDVKQFEKNLWDLGYRDFTVDEEYTDATATAVKKWQKSAGLTQSGTVELGRVVYAAGPVRVDAHKLQVGAVAQPGAAVLTYTGSVRVATVDLAVSDQRLAVQDAAVEVTLPNGTKTPGKVAAIQTVVDSGDGSDKDSEPQTKIEVTISLDDQKALDGLDQATAGVAFTASRRDGVLTVPVAALLALAEGGYGVQVVEGNATRLVAVQTGLFAGGRVEVSGTGLGEGTVVGMPS